MVFKLFGASLFLIGAVLSGVIRAQALSYRVLILTGIYDALIAFENEIRYKLSPMQSALSAAAAHDISGIFKAAAEGVSTLGAVSSMKRAAGTGSLTQDERRAIISFAEGLSAEDAEGQIKNAALCRERINKILQNAEQRKTRLYKLYIVSGGVCGVAALLLII